MENRRSPPDVMFWHAMRECTCVKRHAAVTGELGTHHAIRSICMMVLASLIVPPPSIGTGGSGDGGGAGSGVHLVAFAVDIDG